MLTPLEEVIKKYRRIRYWCGDESRMGLITLWARKLTLKGVQPVGIEQWCARLLLAVRIGRTDDRREFLLRILPSR
jgi:hypothetical protein